MEEVIVMSFLNENDGMDGMTEGIGNQVFDGGDRQKGIGSARETKTGSQVDQLGNMAMGHETDGGGAFSPTPSYDTDGVDDVAVTQLQPSENRNGLQDESMAVLSEPVSSIRNGSFRHRIQSGSQDSTEGMDADMTGQTVSVPTPSRRPEGGDGGRVAYMPTQEAPYDRGRKIKRSGRGKHAPWLVGGIAIGAIVAGLGMAGARMYMSDGANVPDHPAVRWDGTKKDEPETPKDGNDGASSAGILPSSTDESGTPTLARNVAEQCLPSVVAIHVSDGRQEGAGSGVIVDEDGHVLTNSHVVKDMSKIVVVSGNGEEYEAKLLGLDDSSDLAVLDVDWGEAEVRPMAYGDSSELMVGDWVMTIGSPYGLDQSVSTGIVSALSRNQMMDSYDGYRIYANLIQTDAAINLGNSGGALVDSNGKLVGINSMLASSSGSYSAVGFAIPSNYAKRVADQIIAGKDVEHAYIGAQFGNVSRLSMQQNESPYGGPVVDESGKEVSEQDGTPTTGAYVADVVEDSPAKEAGLQKGDIITKFGDERINSASGIIMAIRAHEIGDTVKMTVWRDGEEVTLDVTLGSDAGKGLYDSNGSSTQGTRPQEQQNPYEGMDGWEYFERMLEELGFN